MPSDDFVQIPTWLYERMANCYYGRGPRAQDDIPTTPDHLEGLGPTEEDRLDPYLSPPQSSSFIQPTPYTMPKVKVTPQGVAKRGTIHEE